MLPILSSYDSHEVLKQFKLKQYRTYVFISLLVFSILFVEAFVFFLIEEDAIQVTAWLLLIPAVIALIVMFIYRRKYNDLKQDVVINPLESLYDDYDTEASKFPLYYYVQTGKSQSMAPLMALFYEHKLDILKLSTEYKIYKQFPDLNACHFVFYEKEKNGISKVSEKFHLMVSGKKHTFYMIKDTHESLFRYFDYQHISYEKVKKGSN
jgi:hypothetical protein